MFSNLFESTTIPMLQEAVNFAQSRHTVLAGNIANMDTPGYQIRDLSVEDFQSRLKGAIEARRRPQLPISPGDLAERSTGPFGQISKNPKTVTRHDKNNIGMEFQVTEMVKNQMQHNLALAVMNSQFQLLQAAISERV
ncbi:MAG TPA: flagellar basal body rod protein FlgB [Thermoguttaceae bacterium]|nr:flagellar basal body rod protein FlgB [Thermoguttaceae bacterium]